MFAEDNYNYKAANDKNITVDNIGNISADFPVYIF